MKSFCNANNYFISNIYAVYTQRHYGEAERIQWWRQAHLHSQDYESKQEPNKPTTATSGTTRQDRVAELPILQVRWQQSEATKRLAPS